MLFLAIFTYAPEDRDQVISRRHEVSADTPHVKILGEWFDVSGHRVFRLFSRASTLAAACRREICVAG